MKCGDHLAKTPCRVQRASELLGKSVQATYQDVARGRVPYRRIGRSLVFFEEEIVEFLDKQPGMRIEEVESPTPTPSIHQIKGVK